MVPVFSIMTVASILVGLMLVFGIGFEVGIRNSAKDALLAVASCEKERRMNWDQIEGMWKQLTGSAREQWGKLTDDDWQTIAGKEGSVSRAHSGTIWNREGRKPRNRRTNGRALRSNPRISTATCPASVVFL